MSSRTHIVSAILVTIGVFALISVALARPYQEGDKDAAHKANAELAGQADAVVVAFQALEKELERQKDAGTCKVCNNLRGVAAKMVSRFGTIYTFIADPAQSKKGIKGYRSALQMDGRMFGMISKDPSLENGDKVRADWKAAVDSATKLVDGVEAAMK